MTFRRSLLLGAAAALAVGAAAIAILGASYRNAIGDTIDRVLAAGRGQPGASLAVPPDLPAPVARYFDYVFQGKPPRPLRVVRMVEEGEFRRPGATGWAPMTVQQYVAPGGPAFVFTGTTPLLPGVTARAMDAYVDGHMEMTVKVLSAVTVVDERGGALDRTSLMRFVIEAPLFPSALLPGPHLRWEPIDATQARAVVLAGGAPIGAYRATFAADGPLLELWAEDGGDPATAHRFHGAGEVAARGDYRPVDGVMVPHAFTLSRRFGDRVEPFWKGTVTYIDFDVFERLR
ncbi:DUF6920 family protein [Novispirillum sp. DQ9]|uniref:DUF6920 family protein n=1 Tax=Novispirillum sp. DQ9 TaxID=3398612 RepID=UPI003C7ECA85